MHHALLHPQNPETLVLRWVKAFAVILNREPQSSAVFAQRNPSLVCSRMPGCVSQRLLNYTEDAGAVLLWKIVNEGFRSDIHHHRSVSGYFARKPLERRYQTQVVQH